MMPSLGPSLSLCMRSGLGSEARSTIEASNAQLGGHVKMNISRFYCGQFQPHTRYRSSYDTPRTSHSIPTRHGKATSRYARSLNAIAKRSKMTRILPAKMRSGTTQGGSLFCVVPRVLAICAVTAYICSWASTVALRSQRRARTAINNTHPGHFCGRGCQARTRACKTLHLHLLLVSLHPLLRMRIRRLRWLGRKMCGRAPLRNCGFGIDHLRQVGSLRSRRERR